MAGQLLSGIAIEALVYRYPNASRNAVDGLTFQCSPGTATAILGPNGAGKSTTMDMMCGARVPTSGTIHIDGIDIARSPEEVRKRASYLFQYRALGTWLTVEETARIGAAFSGRYTYMPFYRWMSPAYRKEVEHLAELLSLTKQMHTLLRELSGGQKRKAELLRALVMRPRVLFLDEPTVGLDPDARAALWKHVLDLRGAGELTVFVATHFLDEAEDMDQIVIVHGGALRAVGTPASLRSKYNRTRLRLDAQDGVGLRRELEQLGLPFDGEGPFTVDVRPDDAASIVQRLRTPLSALDVDRGSLEDAYLQISEEERS